MFLKAKPVWLKDLAYEMNIQARFVTEFTGADNLLLKLTGASFYKVLLNGRLIHYGPAPTAKGYARVDEIALAAEAGSNRLEIEAASYNCYNFECVKQPGFIQAEIVSADGTVLAATGYDFAGYRVNSRLQKTTRYSFQRQFAECWNLHLPDTACEIEIRDLDVIYLKRRAPMPDLEPETIEKAICVDTYSWIENDWQMDSLQGAIDRIDEQRNGFVLDEITETPWLTVSKLGYTISDKPQTVPMKLAKGQFAMFKNKKNTAGLFHITGTAAEGTKLLFVFDEKLVDGQFRYKHWEIVNTFSVAMSGKVDFTNFVISGFQLWAIYVLEGAIDLDSAEVIKCRNSMPEIPRPNTEDEVLQKIYDAAVETYKCNSLGIYMDCPSRERAGWLCDSYFTAQAEYAFTGETWVEDDFVENYLIQTCETIPRGMLPSMYPTDLISGSYMPQWAMWFILELDQYKDRNKAVSVDSFYQTAYDLLAHFEGYENEYGLLERTPNNFLEWSKANDWGQDVNYPSNMLYSEMLEVIGKWYQDEKLLKKAESIRQTIREMSFDGQFFRDHSVRNEKNELILCEDISEVCQHYAFRFGVADSESYPELYRILLEELKPSVQKWGFPKLNSLMGMYMRMELLNEWGLHDVLEEEIKDFFGHMADITGTLWEHKHMLASLNHGFASYIGALLLQMYP
ncbi:MAG: hypothetical protein IKC46_03395 [Lachnospiraceae bacterium]|nr:hypothetical protein [Lachnospiraceae bacterium]